MKHAAAGDYLIHCVISSTLAPNYRLWNSLSTGDELNVWLQLSALNTSPPLSCCLFLGLAVWGLVGQNPQRRHPRCYGQVKILTFSRVWNTQSINHSSGITQKTDCLTQEKDRTTIEFNITSSWTQHPVFYTLQINNTHNKYERTHQLRKQQTVSTSSLVWTAPNSISTSAVGAIP